MADISKLSRLINGVVRNVTLTNNTLVLENVKLNLGGANQMTFAGSLTANRTITIPDSNVDLANIANLYTLAGVSLGATDLGTFTGSIIPDNSTIKGALQELETAVENINVTEVIDATFRIKDNVDNTKQIAFQAFNIGTGETRTIIMPDADIDLAEVNQAILQDGSRAMAANLSLGGNRITNIATPVNPGDAANKAFVEAFVASLDFQKDINAYVANANTTAPGVGLPAAATGQRYILASNTGSLNAAWGTIAGVGDNDIVEYDGTDWFVAYDVSVQGEGVLVWNRDQNYFMRWDGTSWDEFGGLAGITAGAGLIKSGNVLSIELDTNAGLEFDTPGDAGKLRVQVDDSTIERHSTGIRVKALGITANQLAANSVEEAKIANNAVTTNKIANNAVDQNKIATAAYDQVTITGGGGTAAAVQQSPKLVATMVAGESYAANTTFAVRMAITGETAGRVYKATNNAATNDLFYVVGLMGETVSIIAANNIGVTLMGEYTLKSNDTPFASGDVGKPVFLTTAGGFSTTAPSGADIAITRIGIVMATNKILVQPQFVAIDAA